MKKWLVLLTALASLNVQAETRIYGEKALTIANILRQAKVYSEGGDDSIGYHLWQIECSMPIKLKSTADIRQTLCTLFSGPSEHAPAVRLKSTQALELILALSQIQVDLHNDPSIGKRTLGVLNIDVVRSVHGPDASYVVYQR